ncbi:sigma-70 family RNA polymerase sigma factor [Paenibacillus sp. JTLBN-2024]
MIDPSRDAALVKQVLAGHKDSFAQLVDTHKNKIYGLLLGMGASPQDAQDYTQEAFLKAYRKLASFREDSSFASWLYTIAVNVMRDAMRKKKTCWRMTASLARKAPCRNAGISLSAQGDRRRSAAAHQPTARKIPHRAAAAIYERAQLRRNRRDCRH